MVGVSQYSHEVAHPRFREDDVTREPREPFVPVIVHQPLRRGVVLAKRSKESAWAAWTLGGAVAC
jgi:hypothetical protein